MINEDLATARLELARLAAEVEGVVGLLEADFGQNAAPTVLGQDVKDAITHMQDSVSELRQAVRCVELAIQD